MLRRLKIAICILQNIYRKLNNDIYNVMIFAHLKKAIVYRLLKSLYTLGLVTLFHKVAPSG